MTSDLEPRNEADFSMEEAPPPEESGNRTFIIVAGILGGLTLLALVCIALYAFIFLPRQRTQREAQINEVNAQNTQVAMALTQTSAVLAFTPTFTPTERPANTPTRTSTPVVVVPTNTVASTPDPRTATVAALLTQAASITQTILPTTTALPSTGFADDIGLTGLLGLAVVLVAVIFLARRLRAAT